MTNNGWISVFDSERPTSKEDVLTLCYTGTFPAPADMFGDPDDRAYSVCTYFYQGDIAYDEAEIIGPDGQTYLDLVKRIIEKDGFYYTSYAGFDHLCKWRRHATIADGNKLGIVCWKHLDYPSPQFD